MLGKKNIGFYFSQSFLKCTVPGTDSLTFFL